MNEANAGYLPFAVNKSNALMFDANVTATVSGTQTSTNKTLSTGTVFSAAPTIKDGNRFTFSPDTTNTGSNTERTTADQRRATPSSSSAA